MVATVTLQLVSRLAVELVLGPNRAHDLPLIINPHGPQAGLLRAPGRVSPVQVSDVAREVQVCLGDEFKVSNLELHVGVGVFDNRRMLFVELSFKLGQGEGGLAGVSDLSPIPAVEGVLVEVFPDKIAYFNFVGLEIARGVNKSIFDELQVQTEDLKRVGSLQFRVVQADVDTGRKGLVKVTDTVGREEKDSSVVLKNSQED